MRAVIRQSQPEYMNDESIDLLLDEAERALLDVESRCDEPNRRVASLDGDSAEVAEFRMAIAELADLHPSLHYELESINDRLRNVGARAATKELEFYPHLIQLVRLSLEVFFRRYPTLDAYETDFCRNDELGGLDEELQSATELYEAHQQLSAMLRRYLC